MYYFGMLRFNFIGNNNEYRRRQVQKIEATS